MQSELQQRPRMARCAPAEMYKCSEPYETHGLSERLPRLPPSLLPSLVMASSPCPSPGLGAAEERNLPPPSPPHTPLPTTPPVLSLLLPHPPTHSPARGSRRHRHSQPCGCPPARSKLPGPAPARRSQGETETEGKKLQLGLRGSALGRESWQAGCATRKALSSPLFGPRAARFCCNLDSREEVKCTWPR